MRRSRLLWQIFGAQTALLWAAVLVLLWQAYQELQARELSRLRETLRQRADLVATALNASGDVPLGAAQIARLTALGRPGGVRITLVGSDGRVLGDSHRHGADLGALRARPEVRAALAGRPASAVRHSERLDEEWIYYARPVVRSGRVGWVVRCAVPTSAVHARLTSLLSRLGLWGLIVAVLGAAASFLVARRLVRPLGVLEEGARRFAAGDLRHRVDVAPTHELGALGEAMNRMAEHLEARIRAVTQQRNELEAVLASMVEAVVVADSRGRILRVNRAATNLLGLDPDAVAGASVGAALGHPELVEVFHRLDDARPSVETTLELGGQDRRTFRVVVTQLRDGSGRRLGSLAVLHDVTQLKRLETVRRDFVANVSHELRTPITAIQGYVETLRDGALAEPEHAAEFLEIIARQSARLGAIVEDLLCLSRIEMQGKAGQIAREAVSVRDVVENALAPYGERARSAGGALTLQTDPDTEAEVNAPLVEQAVVNLVDNAFKYAGPTSHVQVAVRGQGPRVVISVSDDGPGIPEAHQPRVFERFYRVDKARSRAVGGTGLGLAIVKHIAVAHQGEVAVRSTPGKGACFEIRLPRRAAAGRRRED